MGILLGFAPFIVFSVLARLVSPEGSLSAAALVSAALVIREKRSGKSTKILGVGTCALFTLLGACTLLIDAKWDIPVVRSVVDAGLLFIMLLSLVVGQPFTLQYAREEVPPELHSSPIFIRINYVITTMWAGAMAIIVAADLAMHFFPGVPLWVEVCTIVSALVAASWFTKWYPEQQRRGLKSST